MRAGRPILIAVVLGVLAACADNGASREPEADSSKTTAAAGPATRTPDPESTPFVSAAARHMHGHASQLRRIETALAAGDLEAAGTPAFWLSQHGRMPGLPDGWEPYLARIRAEAELIDATADLDAARAAARRLAESCRGCHYTNGLEIDISAPLATPVSD